VTAFVYLSDLNVVCWGFRVRTLPGRFRAAASVGKTETPSVPPVGEGASSGRRTIAQIIFL
jgi:hypothetical protein